MKQITAIFFIFFLISTSLTFACTCSSKENFLNVAPKSVFVALVEVKDYLSYKNIDDEKIPMSMDVEILKVFNGEESRKRVVVWGDNGNLCRPYLSKFKLGEYYVIAFFRGQVGTEYTHIDEKETDFTISNCGEFWLKADIKSRNAVSEISKFKTEISFENLLIFFQKDNSKNITSKDYKKIFKLILDCPELQAYFKIDQGTKSSEIVIQNFENAEHNNLFGVKKFGRQVKIMTEEEIKKQEIKFYFVVSEWVIKQDFVSLQLSYVGEGLTAKYLLFKEIDENWIIISTKLHED